MTKDQRLARQAGGKAAYCIPNPPDPDTGIYAILFDVYISFCEPPTQPADIQLENHRRNRDRTVGQNLQKQNENDELARRSLRGHVCARVPAHVALGDRLQGQRVGSPE